MSIKIMINDFSAFLPRHPLREVFVYFWLLHKKTDTYARKVFEDDKERAEQKVIKKPLQKLEA